MKDADDARCQYAMNQRLGQDMIWRADGLFLPDVFHAFDKDTIGMIERPEGGGVTLRSMIIADGHRRHAIKRRRTTLPTSHTIPSSRHTLDIVTTPSKSRSLSPILRYAIRCRRFDDRQYHATPYRRMVRCDWRRATSERIVAAKPCDMREVMLRRVRKEKR